MNNALRERIQLNQLHKPDLDLHDKVIILEIDDSMDTAFVLVFLACIFGVFIGPIYVSFWMIPLMIIGMIAVPIIKFSARAYYELDTEMKSITFVREVAGYRSAEIKAYFRDVDTIVTNFQFMRGKHYTSFDYGIFLITKSPAIIRVTEWRDNSLDRYNTLSEKLSEVLDCKYLPGETEQKIRVVQDDTSGEMEVSFTLCERAAAYRAREQKWKNLGF